MFKKLCLVSLVLFITLVNFPFLSFANLIYLKNGQEIEGEILENNQEYVVLKIRSGQVRLGREQIKLIKNRAIPPDFFKKEHTLSSKKEDIAKNQNLKATILTAKKQDNEAPAFTLSVEARFKKTSNRELILIKGNTNLPDNTILYIFLKKETDIIVGCKTDVKYGTFTAKMGPFDKQVKFGRYLIEAIFMPLRQRDENVKKILGVKGEKILRVSEGELEHIEETSEKKIKAKCELLIGTTEEIKTELITQKRQLKSCLKQLRLLYNELNYKFDLHRENKEKNEFNKENWRQWSTNWKNDLNDIELLFKQCKQLSLYPSFPEIERDLREICNNLFILWGLYSNELEEGPNPFSYLLMTSKPKDLILLLEKLFNEVAGEFEPLAPDDIEILKSAS